MTAQAPLLDIIMATMSSAQRPLDFALLSRYPRSKIDFNKLKLGAKNAQAVYPSTGSIFQQNSWLLRPDKNFDLRSARAQNATQAQEEIANFINEDFDIKSEFPIKQLLLEDDSSELVTLVTRLHHAAGDLQSLSFWLECQLSNQSALFETEPLRLKSVAKKISKSPFSFWGPSDRLWFSGKKLSAQRRWKTFEFQALAKHPDFTYNDILCTCALETARSWNLQQGTSGQKISLWVPINIREKGSRGFGNGTSRIRLYAREYSPSLIKKCLHTRQQVNASKKNGEWMFPLRPKILSLPPSLSAPLLRAHIHRPWVDMGTLLFSHFEQPANGSRRFLDSELVVHLHERYPLGMAAITEAGVTRLTLTYDPQLLLGSEMETFANLFLSHLRRFKDELEGNCL